MLNRLIEVNDKLNELKVNVEKLDFILQNELNKLEDRIDYLKENDKIEVLFSSGIEKNYLSLNIANDYKHIISKTIDQAEEELSKIIDETRSLDNEI